MEMNIILFQINKVKFIHISSKESFLSFKRKQYLLSMYGEKLDQSINLNFAYKLML